LSGLGDFVLKSQQVHAIPITITSSSRSTLGSPFASSSYRASPANGRSNHDERQFSSILNEKSYRNSNFYDTKYDNCSSTTNRIQYDTITLTLRRDRRILDFGFSISDRLYGTGVYVNKIRPNGPAELEGTLMPCMRIYKVKSISISLSSLL